MAWAAEVLIDQQLNTLVKALQLFIRMAQYCSPAQQVTLVSRDRQGLEWGYAAGIKLILV